MSNVLKKVHLNGVLQIRPGEGYSTPVRANLRGALPVGGDFPPGDWQGGIMILTTVGTTPLFCEGTNWREFIADNTIA